MADGAVQEREQARRPVGADGEPLGARAISEMDRCWAVEKVIAEMHERIDRPFSLDEMARIAYLSPFYFNRVFRQITGLPPRRFHTALRIAAAKRLLLTTDLSVTEVCLEVGYQSLGTFTTQFHELVGVAPRQFRRLGSEPFLAPAEMAPALARAHDAAIAPVVVGGVYGAAPDWLVFVGLFAHPYPQGVPIACTALGGGGPYALRTPAQGRYHVAAAAFAPTDDVRRCLLPEGGSVLVGSADDAVQLSPGGRTIETLRLRPLRTTDPPILLALPLTAAWQLARGA
jgi:AraC family transcriptional regulator